MLPRRPRLAPEHRHTPRRQPNIHRFPRPHSELRLAAPHGSIVRLGELVEAHVVAVVQGEGTDGFAKRKVFDVG